MFHKKQCRLSYFEIVIKISYMKSKFFMHASKEQGRIVKWGDLDNLGKWNGRGLAQKRER